MSFSLPPPRRAASSSAGMRRPKVNPMASARKDLSLGSQSEDQDTALAQLLSQSHIHSDHPQQPHLPQCRHYSRPRSIASISSLNSESYSTYASTQNGRRPSQALRSPHLETNEPTSSSTTRICTSCLSPSCPSVAIFEDGQEGAQTCQRRAMSFSEDGSEQCMGDAAGYLPSCSYCSSVRSDSVTSILSPEASAQSFQSNRLERLRALVPSEVRRRISFHLDECWFVLFSPSAEYMASIGCDHSVVVWKDLMCPDPSIHFSTNLSRTITAVAWSPDSKYLLINLGYDKKNPCYTPTVKLIDVQSGEIVFKKHYMKNGDNFHANAVCWFPDSKRFLTAVEGVYCIWDLNGDVIREYPVNNELTGRHLTAIPGTEKFIINTFDTIEIISFDDTISTKLLDRNICTKFSMTVSGDGAYLAVTLRGEKCVDRPAQIALYDLRSMTFMRFFEAETYIDEAFVIVPTFVGPNMELLCAGSENGKLHYWDIETGELVSLLEEHSLHVGGVSANPGHPGMVASCSDDSLVIIWATKQLQLELKEGDDKWMREHPVVAMPTVNIKKGW